MNRDHTIFNKAITGINEDLGKKINIEVHAISYMDISNVAYIAATTTESIAKQKFIKSKTAKEQLYIPWDESITHEPMSIGHDNDRKYELAKLSINDVEDVVAIGPAGYNLLLMPELPEGGKPVKGNMYLENEGFDLLLMSELPEGGKPVKGKMYLERTDSKIKYKVLGPQNNLVEGALDDLVLTPEILRTMKSQILEETSKRGHTINGGNKLKYKVLDPHNNVIEDYLDINIDRDLSLETLRAIKSQILIETSKRGHTIGGNEFYPVVTDLDLHYINFGKNLEENTPNIYKRLYCDGLAGSVQMQSQMDDLLSRHWDNKWMAKIKAFAGRWLGWVSPAEVIVMFYINLFHKRLFKYSQESWKNTLLNFPLVSHGVTAGFNINNYKEVKMLSKSLPSTVKECPIWNSNPDENLSKFPGMDDYTQVCIVTADKSEIKIGKQEIMEAYMGVPGEGELRAALHPYWQ
jgi:hypothetical protein